MIRLQFARSRAESLTVLCVGAHSDDIEIGCGGTLLQLLNDYPALAIHWVVLSAEGEREREARRSAELFASSRLRQVLIKDFRDGFLPYHGAEVKSFFETEVKSLSPDVIFTHNRKDAHQDHRLVSELTKNSFRDHLILEYEIPKYDGDLGQPTIFVPLDSDLCTRKVDYIMDVFNSQQAKSWFNREIFLSLMRLRGVESNAISGYAEAFYAHKVVL